MTAPSEFSDGDLVEYRLPGAAGAVVERGVVTSRNERFVFVRFGLQQHSKACSAAHLRRVAVRL